MTFVKRMFALLLLIGAMFGLLGQQTAAAASAVPVTTSSMSSTMSADCMEMMGAHKPDPAKKPCNGLTLDCIFATGCAVPLMRDPVDATARAPILAPPLFWTRTAVLIGSDRAPEIHPPTILD